VPNDRQGPSRRIYAQAKAEASWRFWVCAFTSERETLAEAYCLAKRNNGAPGVDGVSFEAIEASGIERSVEEIQNELTLRADRPMRNRRQEIAKGSGPGDRVLSIPTDDDVMHLLRMIGGRMAEWPMLALALYGKPRRAWDPRRSDLRPALNLYLFPFPAWQIIAGWLTTLAAIACAMVGAFLVLTGGTRMLAGGAAAPRTEAESGATGETGALIGFLLSVLSRRVGDWKRPGKGGSAGIGERP
jgi:hypothetical protein